MESMTPAPRHAPFSSAKALVRDNPLLVAIAAIGFAVSFQTIAHLARAQHMPGWPVLYPVLIDLGILALVIEARKAIDDGGSDLVPRVLAWLLAGFTVYVNAHGSPAHDWLGVALHVVGPALWVVFLELTRWRKVRRTPTEEEVRLARATADARRYAIDLCRSLRGPAWRWRIPSLLRINIARSRFPDEVAEDIARCVRLGKSTGWQQAVRGWVTGPDGLNLQAQAERDATRAAESIRQNAPEPAPQIAAETVPEPAPRTVSQVRPERVPAALPKLTAKRARDMSPSELVPWAAALLEDVPDVSVRRASAALHVGAPKATEALRLARKDRLHVAAK